MPHLHPHSMTTDPTITASLAAACAAHDRHRLDVLDALLDEVAPSAVRELLGAALDLCASLRADRDEREAAIGATFAKQRAEIDAATGQLAAARQVIDEERTRAAHASRDLSIALNERDEERATVARLTARVAELEARPVLTAQWLTDRLAHLGYSRTHAEMDAQMILGMLAAPLMPAQDRAEELSNAYVDAWNGNSACRGGGKDIAKRTDAMRRALASLGAPAPSPPAAIDRSLALTAASLLRDIVMNGGLAEGGEIGPRASDYLDMMRRLETTPTAAPGLVAAVSVEELTKVYSKAYGEIGDVDDPDRTRAIGAVLARLNATTIAPVDPEAVARAYHDHKDAPAPEWDEVSVWRGRDADEKPYAIAAMRATLTAAGIPVTPEVGK